MGGEGGSGAGRRVRVLSWPFIHPCIPHSGCSRTKTSRDSGQTGEANSGQRDSRFRLHQVIVYMLQGYNRLTQEAIKPAPERPHGQPNPQSTNPNIPIPTRPRARLLCPSIPLNLHIPTRPKPMHHPAKHLYHIVVPGRARVFARGAVGCFRGGEAGEGGHEGVAAVGAKVAVLFWDVEMSISTACDTMAAYSPANEAYRGCLSLLNASSSSRCAGWTMAPEFRV